jgi:hypothetical protein
MICFLDNFMIETSKSGETVRVLQGVSLEDLLRRRIAPYYAGSPEVDVSGPADNLMKQVVRDNLASNDDYASTAPDPSRDLSDNGLSVEADESLGPTISKGFSWQNVLSALQAMQAASRAAGVEVFFALEATGESTMRFITTVGQPGADRTVETGVNPIIFSPEWGNLVNPSLEFDYSEAANVIYAGGQGQGDARIIAKATDQNRAEETVFSLREAFANATSAKSLSGVTSEAQNQLTLSRPKLNFSASLLDTPAAPYGGAGWNVGDRVTVSYQGVQFSTIIRSVSVKVKPNGEEIVSAKVEETITI